MSFSPESYIIQRIINDDQRAFQDLYNRLSPTIFNAAFSYVKDEETAKEIVQEAFVKLWDNRKKLTGIKNPDAYVFMIARNLVFDQFQKKVCEAKLYRSVREQSVYTVNDTGYRVENKQMDEILHHAVKTVPPQQHKVYVLNKQEGLDFDQIASRMQLSQNTVKKHLELANHYVRRFVRTRLSGFFFQVFILLSVNIFF